MTVANCGIGVRANATSAGGEFMSQAPAAVAVLGGSRWKQFDRIIIQEI